ncbi:MAG: hypothetical protein VBE63_24460 [Lamprobacter sp.]|uniref:hypothetical protein n=1 Tax=Lamprobacter sp. TaxID=3100796 RepID=UPI002B25F09B|nr:hypothetical protein [Lamprobacter sp.]MEA3643068.1 hypothetical protein [Lamprobacter sp.]
MPSAFVLPPSHMTPSRRWRAQYFCGLTEAGADPAQISQATEILQQILRSDLPSIAARLAVPAERLRPLIGNYGGGLHLWH